jgi:LDH2 family malate/lactate/ureidoglycolate dehydrogenase
MDGLTSAGTAPAAARPTTVDADGLIRICARILEAAGTPVEAAEIVGRSLATADLRGVSSHGVSRLPAYLRRVQAGLIQPAAVPEIVAETPASVTIDAGAGFGHAIGWYAMGAAIERAATHGIGAAAVRNSTHFGIAGFFAERASAQGLVGIATSNGAALMAPPGTSTRVLGTNPLAVAIPNGDAGPILLDMATSTAALGKILLARDAGTAIPAGWALDLEGRPTSDPAVAAAGLLTPLGGHKGFGLALALEVLSAGLSGASAGPNAGSVYRTWDRPENLGHFFLAIDPAAFGGAQSFLATVAGLAEAIHGATTVAGGVPALLPGEVERQQEARARRDGLPVTLAMAASLEEAASLAGLASPW